MLNKIRNRWTGLVAAFAGLALMGCATQPVSTEAGAMRPAIWRLADADTTIYLFGTIHTLPEGVAWRTPALEAALAASNELVTEVDMSGDQMAAAATMLQLSMASGLPPILDRVPADERDKLRQAIEATRIPVAAFDRMKTWAAAVTLAGFAFQRAGLDPELGVDRRLTVGFVERQLPVSGLETVEEQLGFFDGLPEADQREFLVGVLETPEEIRSEFDLMLAAWGAGDIDAISRTFDDEANISAALREILLTRRNARWAEWLQQRLERPGTVFVAVGAGHLAGHDSVQNMLRQRGLETQRVH